MAELHDVAEAIVAEGRRSFPICPSPFGCDYCDDFGCPVAMCEIAEAYPRHFTLSVEHHDGAVRYFLRRVV